MTKSGWLAALLACVVFTLLAIRPGAGQTDEQELWRRRHLGKALFETPAAITEAPAELKKAMELAPDSFRDRLNYGLALLRAGQTKEAIVQLEIAQKQHPAFPHTWFNLGVAYRRVGRNMDAVRQFEQMARLVPDEPVTRHSLGLLYNLQDRGTEALEQFRLAAKLDPNFVAPRFQIYTYYRLIGDEAAAGRALADFEALKARPQDPDEKEDLDWCVYSELYDPVQAKPAPRDASPPAPPQFEERKLAGAVDPLTAGLLVLNAADSENPDLVAWSRTGLLLYRSGKLVADSGLAGVEAVLNVSAGDFDNDGLPDLCVLTESGARILRNVGGQFANTAFKLPAGRFRKAVWLDFDHDYDLDLFLLGDTSVLLRNQGGGSFEAYTSHFPFARGRAVDAVAFRSTPDTKGVDVAVSYADHPAVLYRDRLRGVFQTEALDAIPPDAVQLRAIDIDNDGATDLAFSSASGRISLAINRNGRFAAVSTRAAGAYIFADLENRGFDDVVAANGIVRNQGLLQFANPIQPPGFASFTALAQADFDDDGRTDLAAITPDGSVRCFLNRSATKNSWLKVTLRGVKNLKAAVGADVEIKSGDRFQKAVYEGVPLLFGLGSHTRADAIRITWPNGMIQNEVNQAGARKAQIKEAPRLAGSCPMVFTWNGATFQFITDVLGVAPLGASSGGDEYFPVDHREFVSIPAEAMALRQGTYEIRVTEELREVTYLDQAQLIAMDHPRDVEIFTNDKFKSPPFPEFRLYSVKRRVHPVAARDTQGRTVLESVLRQDGIYASGFRHDSAGIAEMHSLTLDFGPLAAPDNRAVLLLNGWVDWADGSAFLNASQRSGGGLAFPYLQVKDAAGEWRTVVDDMGIPSGKPKTIAVDLTGKFLARSREIRIVTNLCVYWDEIFLSDDASAPSVRLSLVDAESASLRLRGFSKTVIDSRREHPERFDYGRWTPDAMWNPTPGLYTRYGDVRELVLTPDDRFVIMGSGDELQLRYPAAALPPLPNGWRRDFLLLIDGWAKDADANTAFSQTVDPLPFHAMSCYPYPATEHYPEDESHSAYRRQYNTRPAVRFISPLLMRRTGL